jgi:hypothetical protein
LEEHTRSKIRTQNIVKETTLRNKDVKDKIKNLRTREHQCSLALTFETILVAPL